MKIRILNRRLLAMTLSLSAALGLASQADAYDVYHGVHANAVTGAVIWTQPSFIVSGVGAPNLSFFHFAGDPAAIIGLPNAQCIVKVHLPNTIPAPLVNALDTVGNAAVAIADPVALQFPWTIVFDNNPAGHWNIAKGEIVDLNHVPVPFNPVAGRVAATGFHNLATNPGNNFGVTVINGILENCHA